MSKYGLRKWSDRFCSILTTIWSEYASQRKATYTTSGVFDVGERYDEDRNRALSKYGIMK